MNSLANDPVTFGIQVARRFPAAREPLLAASRFARGADQQIVQVWLAGNLVATRALLDELAGAGTLSRFAAEIAHAAGRPELVVDDAQVHPLPRARAAWQLGDASLAIRLLEEHAPTSRLHRTLRAEIALVTPGNRLCWAAPNSADSRADRSGVLHLLTNSLPHTQSGYTMRSHAVLLAQRDAGLAPTAMTRSGYPVIVGGLSASAVDVIDGIEYRRALPTRLASTPDGRLVQQADALAQRVLDVRPAFLQTTTHYLNALVVREVAEQIGLPWAYEVRGMLEQTWVASLGSDVARERAAASSRFRLTREREAELANAANAVFTLSSSMRDDLAARGVSREKITLVPNGIDASQLTRQPPAPADARQSLGLPRTGFWVGSTSSLVDYEGFEVLLEAVRIGRTMGHDIRALIAGDGVARQSLESQISASGLTGSAILAGRVPRTKIAAYRDALDLFIVPRLDRAVTRTVSPLKPVEAMASGRPLLVTALPALLETIGADLQDLGAAVPPNDALALANRIVALSLDRSARDQMVKLGRLRASALTWPAIGATYRRTLTIVGS